MKAIEGNISKWSRECERGMSWCDRGQYDKMYYTQVGICAYANECLCGYSLTMKSLTINGRGSA